MVNTVFRFPKEPIEFAIDDADFQPSIRIRRTDETQYAEHQLRETRYSQDRLRPFIGGPENAAVRVALEAAVNSHRYNPLLLFGVPGVGKSHLLQLLASQFSRTTGSSQIVSIAGSDYARAVKAARELNALDELREKHRSADWFSLDDLQELAPHNRAQQELLHTIDERIRVERQVLVTSRNSLAESDYLLAGLKSRLTSGLVLCVAKPAAAARRELIEEFSRELGLDLSNSLRELLVSPQREYARRLETVSQLRGILAELAMCPSKDPGTLRSLLVQSATQLRFSTRQITTQTARYFRLKTSDLTGPSRRQTTVLARGIAIYLIRHLTTLSLADIGRHFGHRDHSTVLHSYRKTTEAAKNDATVREAIHAVADRLGAAALVT